MIYIFIAIIAFILTVNLIFASKTISHVSSCNEAAQYLCPKSIDGTFFNGCNKCKCGKPGNYANNCRINDCHNLFKTAREAMEYCPNLLRTLKGKN